MAQLLFTSPLLYLILFLFGLIFGSFFNVILFRSVKKDSSWFMGRSYCEACGHLLVWYDNMPLLSFVLLKGSCRYCQAKISFIHPLVEFLTGLVFIFTGYIALNSAWLASWPALLALPYSLVTVSILWLIFLFDLKYGIIPDELTILIAVSALFRYLVLFYFSAISANQFFLEIILAVILFFIFWALQAIPKLLIKKDGMGFGDIKLIAPLALLVGYPQIMIAVFCAFIIGGVWGIILLLLKQKQLGQRIAFGPFLVMGALLALAWGELWWHWYWALL